MNNWIWLVVALVVVVVLVFAFRGPACQVVDGNSICESVSHVPGIALGIPQGAIASPVVEYRQVEIVSAGRSPEGVAFWYATQVPSSGARLLHIKVRSRDGLAGALVLCLSEELKPFAEKILPALGLGYPSATTQADGFFCLVFYGKVID